MIKITFKPKQNTIGICLNMVIATKMTDHDVNLLEEEVFSNILKMIRQEKIKIENQKALGLLVTPPKKKVKAKK